MNNQQQIQLYTSEDDQVKLEVTKDADTLWLTQAQIAELFGTKGPAITKHLGNIFNNGELREEVVCSILEHTTVHEALPEKTQTKGVKYYNLDKDLPSYIKDQPLLRCSIMSANIDNCRHYGTESTNAKRQSANSRHSSLTRAYPSSRCL